MAFKISKADKKIVDEALASVQEKYAVIEQLVADINELVAEKNQELEDAINDYNGALSDLRSPLEETIQGFRDEAEDKSEKWQEGERGQEVFSWIDELESSLSELEDAGTEELLSEIEFDQIFNQTPTEIIENMPLDGLAD